MSKIVSLLSALLLAASSAHAGTDCAHALPASIDAPDDLRRYMAEMLVRSATFRQQCQRLDLNGLRIRIRTDAQLIDRPYRARTTIQRLEDGRVTACVAITPFGDPTQWLAHELEHVIEQLDGVKIPHLASISARVAWRTSDNMFETERAVQIGRLVVREMRHPDRALAHAHAAKPIQPTGTGDD
jgi:hypothetical protein